MEVTSSKPRSLRYLGRLLQGLAQPASSAPPPPPTIPLSQIRVVAIVPKFSGLLSMVGSLLILRDIVLKWSRIWPNKKETWKQRPENNNDPQANGRQQNSIGSSSCRRHSSNHRSNGSSDNNRQRRIHRKSSSLSMSSQLLFLLSVADFTSSFFGPFMSTWMVPPIAPPMTTPPMPAMMDTTVPFAEKEVPQSPKVIYWATGTTETCVAQGFLCQLFFRMSASCNAMLSIVYWLIVSRGWKEAHFRPIKVRLPFLLIPIVLSFGLAILPLFDQAYNPNPSGICNISSYPPNCESLKEEGPPPSALSPPFDNGQSSTGFPPPPPDVTINDESNRNNSTNASKSGGHLFPSSNGNLHISSTQPSPILNGEPVGSSPPPRLPTEDSNGNNNISGNNHSGHVFSSPNGSNIDTTASINDPGGAAVPVHEETASKYDVLDPALEISPPNITVSSMDTVLGDSPNEVFDSSNKPNSQGLPPRDIQGSDVDDGISEPGNDFPLGSVGPANGTPNVLGIPASVEVPPRLQPPPLQPPPIPCIRGPNANLYQLWCNVIPTGMMIGITMLFVSLLIHTVFNHEKKMDRYKHRLGRTSARNHHKESAGRARRGVIESSTDHYAGERSGSAISAINRKSTLPDNEGGGNSSFNNEIFKKTDCATVDHDSGEGRNLCIDRKETGVKFTTTGNTLITDNVSTRDSKRRLSVTFINDSNGRLHDDGATGIFHDSERGINIAENNTCSVFSSETSHVTDARNSTNEHSFARRWSSFSSTVTRVRLSISSTVDTTLHCTQQHQTEGLHDHPPNANQQSRRNIDRNHSRRKYYSYSQRKNTLKTAYQGIWYFLAFTITFLPFFIVTGFGIAGKHPPISKVIGLLITYPLQGFFNAIIYFRPRYLNEREKYPDESRWRILKAVLGFGDWGCFRTRRKGKFCDLSFCFKSTTKDISAQQEVQSESYKHDDEENVSNERCPTRSVILRTPPQTIELRSTVTTTEFPRWGQSSKEDEALGGEKKEEIRECGLPSGDYDDVNSNDYDNDEDEDEKCIVSANAVSWEEESDGETETDEGILEEKDDKADDAV